MKKYYLKNYKKYKIKPTKKNIFKKIKNLSIFFLYSWQLNLFVYDVKTLEEKTHQCF